MKHHNYISVEALALLFSGIEPKPKRSDFCGKICGR